MTVVGGRDHHEDPGDEYEKHTLKVMEIRTVSIFIEINAMTTRPIGRSLLHAASDDRIEKYKGPLPMEFELSVKRWWLERYGFIK
jgi:hypothetical protein